MSNKAARERRFLEREQQRKRFDMPLHNFLENKYPGVYQEYRELYETLNRNHPYTRNLAKTRTFKRWLESINRQPVTDILSTLVKETFDQTETFGSSAEEDETNIDQNVDQTSEATGQASEEDETDIDQNVDQTSEAAGQAVGEDEIDIDQDDQTNETAGQAVQEQLYKVVETTSQSAPQDEANEAAAVLADIMASVEDQVDDIVNELMQEQVIRDMITEPEDEGIEINPLDDITFDLEPFDFNLEVENYDW